MISHTVTFSFIIFTTGLSVLCIFLWPGLLNLLLNIFVQMLQSSCKTTWAFLVHRVMNIFLWFVFSFTRQINSTKASAHFVSVPVNFISTHNARDWWTSKLCLWTSKKKQQVRHRCAEFLHIKCLQLVNGIIWEWTSALFVFLQRASWGCFSS